MGGPNGVPHLNLQQIKEECNKTIEMDDEVTPLGTRVITPEMLTEKLHELLNATQLIERSTLVTGSNLVEHTSTNIDGTAISSQGRAHAMAQIVEIFPPALIGMVTGMVQGLNRKVSPELANQRSDSQSVVGMMALNCFAQGKSMAWHPSIWKAYIPRVAAACAKNLAIAEAEIMTARTDSSNYTGQNGVMKAFAPATGCPIQYAGEVTNEYYVAILALLNQAVFPVKEMFEERLYLEADMMEEALKDEFKGRKAYFERINKMWRGSMHRNRDYISKLLLAILRMHCRIRGAEIDQKMQNTCNMGEADNHTARFMLTWTNNEARRSITLTETVRQLPGRAANNITFRGLIIFAHSIANNNLPGPPNDLTPPIRHEIPEDEANGEWAVRNMARGQTAVMLEANKQHALFLSQIRLIVTKILRDAAKGRGRQASRRAGILIEAVTNKFTAIYRGEQKANIILASELSNSEMDAIVVHLRETAFFYFMRSQTIYWECYLTPGYIRMAYNHSTWGPYLKLRRQWYTQTPCTVPKQLYHFSLANISLMMAENEEERDAIRSAETQARRMLRTMSLRPTFETARLHHAISKPTTRDVIM